MPVFLRALLRLGPLNPIAVRLVQNGSRRRKHLYVRSAYLAVLIVVLLYMLLITAGAGTKGYRELAAAGAQAFTVTAYLQVALICLIAPVFMAGAIAQESDPKTWDILLTTPMSKLEIVLGNLTGRLFLVLALLFCSLPLFALTQYFGGVPGTSIFASYLVAGCSAVLVGAIAIALSVSRLAGRRAVFAFYVAVLTYLGVTAAIDTALGGGARTTHFTALNPFLAMRSLLEPTGYQRAEAASLNPVDAFFLATPVTAWCVLSLSISVLLTLASTLTVRHGGLATIAAGTGRTGVPWYRRMLGLGAKGAEHRPPRTVGRNPIAWREATARNATLGRILARWAFIAVGLLWAIAALALYHTAAFDHRTFRLVVLSTVWTESAVTVLVAMNMAATAVSREREDGTLDILLTTPMTPAVYLTGKLRGLIAYLLPLLAVPVGTLLLAGLYVLAGGLGRAGGVLVQESIGNTTIDLPVLLPESGLLAAGSLLPFTAFCVMIGLQWSLKSKGTIGSVIATVGVVGAVAGTISLCSWKGGSEIGFVGPVLSALSPATTLWACLDPLDAMRETIDASGLPTARLSLLVGVGVAAGVYLAVVYGTHSAMVRNFDFTVRKLAGTR